MNQNRMSFIRISYDMRVLEKIVIHGHVLSFSDLLERTTLIEREISPRVLYSLFYLDLLQKVKRTHDNEGHEWITTYSRDLYLNIIIFIISRDSSSLKKWKLWTFLKLTLKLLYVAWVGKLENSFFIITSNFKKYDDKLIYLAVATCKNVSLF